MVSMQEQLQTCQIWRRRSWNQQISELLFCSQPLLVQEALHFHFKIKIKFKIPAHESVLDSRDWFALHQSCWPGCCSKQSIQQNAYALPPDAAAKHWGRYMCCTTKSWSSNECTCRLTKIKHEDLIFQQDNPFVNQECELRWWSKPRQWPRKKQQSLRMHRFHGNLDVPTATDMELSPCER